MTLKTFDAYSRLSILEINQLTTFLYEHQKDGGFSKAMLRKTIQYAAKERPGFGGMVFTLEDKGALLGVLVVNKTGMEDYVPENLIVAMATDENYGAAETKERLLDYAIAYCRGDIGLYIKPGDLREGFFSGYGFQKHQIEMRLKNK